MKRRTLRFPDKTALGYLHTRPGDYPFSFHGRYKKEGGLLDGVLNAGWNLQGRASGSIPVAADCLLLEVLAEPARDLAPLAHLNPNDLDALWLGNTWADDAQLRHLSHLTGLRWLNVENNPNITDAGLAHLAGLTSLLHLGVHWTSITGSGLDALRGMKRLQFLDVWGCPIDREALAELKSRLPYCRLRTE